MPRRKNQRRVSTPAVQGDDSYVVITLPTVAEIEQVMEQSGDSFRTFKTGSEIIARHVVEWNWVDDDDEPLPLPNGDADVISLLTTDEYRLLLELMLGPAAEEKKS